MATIKYRTSSTAPWITLTNVDSTQPSDTLPLMDGVANAGTFDAYARGDHKHPSDTSRANTNLSNLSDNNEALKNLGAKSNPNLLDNWWFGGGVINQRGVTTWTSGYGIDRWKVVNNVTAEITSSGLKLKTTNTNDYGYFGQKCEKSFGTDVTLSIKLADGTIYSGNNAIDINGFLFYRADENTQFTVRTPLSTAEIVIDSVKLEYGNVSTLANDYAPDYATELLKCQRYYRRYNGSYLRPIATGYASSSTNVFIVIPSQFRTSPSASISGALKVVCNGTMSTVTGISVDQYDKESVVVRIATSGMSLSQPCCLVGADALTNNVLILSADL